ncbi:MAG: hypothetical protein JJU41_07005 [Bacteroidetes bacterium]|nr:hypothetical protein [Bacteroidota bacterium]MCH8523462.1 hypothetical protein [Balneolales bacterium]
MTTAKKLDYNYPVLRSVDAHLVKKSHRRNPLLIETEDIFSLMGWAEIPEKLKLTIAIDMIGFRDEVAGLFSTRNPNVLNRRKRIYYWVNEYLQGNCSLQNAVDALKVSYM